MFLHDFVMNTLSRMIESGSCADYQVMTFALSWFSKSVLSQDDLETIQAKVEKKYPTQEDEQEEPEPSDSDNSETTEAQ